MNSPLPRHPECPLYDSLCDEKGCALIRLANEQDRTGAVHRNGSPAGPIWSLTAWHAFWNNTMELAHDLTSTPPTPCSDPSAVEQRFVELTTQKLAAGELVFPPLPPTEPASS